VSVALTDYFKTNPGSLARVYDEVINLGIDALTDSLVEALERYGTKGMAEVFLNAGHPRLEQAARDWARRHGYQIVPGSTSGGPRWGQHKRP
jgi:hypothetical protein